MRILQAILLAASLTVACAGPAQAQGGQDKNITLTANQLEVREALRLLFAQTGFNYTVESAVQGTVTMSVKDVPFETTLRLVVRQVGATYRVTGGVYEIVVIAPVEPPTAPGSNEADAPVKDDSVKVTRFPVYHADPWVIMMMMSGQQPSSPEWSTVQGIGGFGGSQGGNNQGNNGWNSGPSNGQNWGNLPGGNQPGGRPGGNPGTGFPGGNPGFGNNRGPGGGNGNSGRWGGGAQGGVGGSNGSLVDDGAVWLIDPATNTIYRIEK